MYKPAQLLLRIDHESIDVLSQKWAGKTIALGTFTAAEADEKCQRAKALTKAWRQNMRPRLSREWVIAELERHGVRIVAGRRGTSDNAILYKKNATSAARAASIVAHAAVSAAHEQHANSAAAAAAAAAAARARATVAAQNPAMAAAPMNHHQIGVGGGGAAAAAGPAASAALYHGHPAATTAAPAGVGVGMGAMGGSSAATAGVAAAPMGGTTGMAAVPGAGAGTPGAGMAGGAASASGLRESFTAELGGERSEALAAARRDSLGALFGEGGMMKRRTSLDSLGFAASLLSSGALDALGEMDELETSALRRDMANASAVDGDMPPPGRARRNSSLDLVRFLKSEIGLFDDDGAAGAAGAGAGGGVPGSISISAGGGGDHGALGGATSAGSVMQRRLSNAALQMSLGLGGLSRGIGLDELVASSNPTPGAAVGSAAMSRSASAILGAGPLGGLGSGSSALAAVSGLGPNATPSQHYEMLKLHHMNLLQEIQETTMMMNLYQQQMLQEQQEQLQQEQLKRQQLAAVSPQIGTSMHQQIQANQQLQAAAPHQQQVQAQMQSEAQQARPSTNSQMQQSQQQLQQHHQQLQLQNQAEGNPNNNYAGQQAIPGEATDESAEESIRKLRAEIAERERKMQELTSVGGDPEAAAANNMKRRVSDHEDEASKRAKMAI